MSQHNYENYECKCSVRNDKLVYKHRKQIKPNQFMHL